MNTGRQKLTVEGRSLAETKIQSGIFLCTITIIILNSDTATQPQTRPMHTVQSK